MKKITLCIIFIYTISKKIITLINQDSSKTKSNQEIKSNSEFCQE